MQQKPKTSRRDFLKGRSAIEALADVTQGVLGVEDAAEPTAEERPEGYLIELSRRAMACNFEVFLKAGRYPHGTETALAAFDLIGQLEDQLSIYREHSEVSKINRTAAEQPVQIESRLFQLLTDALELARHSGGAFDITSGPLSDAWGFTRRAGAIPPPEKIQEALDRTGSKHVLLDPASRSIRFAQAGIEINLGSIGKGYALDRAAEIFREADIDDVLLHGGNSSVLGCGSNRAADEGWTVGLRNPLRPTRRLGEIRLRNRALGTSGSATQFFIHEGRRYGHIIDPRTGMPAEGVLSASALAPTAALADALATAFYVLGTRGTGGLCSKYLGVAAILLTPGKHEGTIDLHTWNLRPDEWQMLGENDG